MWFITIQLPGPLNNADSHPEDKASQDSAGFGSPSQRGPSKAAGCWQEPSVELDVNMAFGTDILPLPEQDLQSDAMSLVEFEYLVKYMEPQQALRVATGKAGELVIMYGPNSPYLEGRIGMIKEGYCADMILVNGDPTKNIKWIISRDNFSMIMKEGVIYKNTIGDRPDGKPSVVEINRELMTKLARKEGF